MKLTKALTILLAALAVTLAAPAGDAQTGPRAMHQGASFHGHDFHHNGNGHVHVFVGGFGFPYFYGYPYWGWSYPYYYGYPYGYPVGSPYGYNPNGVYQGHVVGQSPPTNRGDAKDVSVATRVQRQLAAAGYYDGAIDGVVGEGTRRAIRSYQRANGLPVGGRIDHQLLNSMGLG
ncbi:MAG TPA: peptidoglycan-binding protein [Chthoniobacterales bacterium]|jgi:His-Xaa-Ser repeat protein HxsA